MLLGSFVVVTDVVDFDRYFPIFHDKSASRAAADKTAADARERVQSPFCLQLISSMLII